MHSVFMFAHRNVERGSLRDSRKEAAPRHTRPTRDACRSGKKSAFAPYDPDGNRVDLSPRLTSQEAAFIDADTRVFAVFFEPQLCGINRESHERRGKLAGDARSFVSWDRVHRSGDSYGYSFICALSPGESSRMRRTIKGDCPARTTGVSHGRFLEETSLARAANTRPR